MQLKAGSLQSILFRYQNDSNRLKTKCISASHVQIIIQYLICAFIR